MHNVNNAQKIFDIKGKTVVLTGSAGKVGSRFAHTLSNAGANVILVDKESKKNTKLESEIIQKYKTKAIAQNIDINDSIQVENLVEFVLKKYKKIDVLINNAHIVPRNHPKRDAPFEKFPVELWDETISDNMRGIFLCSQKIGKSMVKRKKGIIVNISSIYGIIGPDQRIYGKSRLNSPAYYSATKGAMVNLTKYLASYWGPKNIRVNTLTLGGIYDKKLHSEKEFVKNYSNKTMLGRMSNKEDYDGAILFLASDASSYMTGSNLIIDGGWTTW